MFIAVVVFLVVVVVVVVGGTASFNIRSCPLFTAAFSQFDRHTVFSSQRWIHDMCII